MAEEYRLERKERRGREGRCGGNGEGERLGGRCAGVTERRGGRIRDAEGDRVRSGRTGGRCAAEPSGGCDREPCGCRNEGKRDGIAFAVGGGGLVGKRQTFLGGRGRCAGDGGRGIARVGGDGARGDGARAGEARAADQKAAVVPLLAAGRAAQTAWPKAVRDPPPEGLLWQAAQPTVLPLGIWLVRHERAWAAEQSDTASANAGTYRFKRAFMSTLRP
jgi:hypothetical protein